MDKSELCIAEDSPSEAWVAQSCSWKSRRNGLVGLCHFARARPEVRTLISDMSCLHNGGIRRGLRELRWWSAGYRTLN